LLLVLLFQALLGLVEEQAEFLGLNLSGPSLHDPAASLDLEGVCAKAKKGETNYQQAKDRRSEP
jgi:hypothetical protein